MLKVGRVLAADTQIRHAAGRFYSFRSCSAYIPETLGTCYVMTPSKADKLVVASG